MVVKSAGFSIYIYWVSQMFYLWYLNEWVLDFYYNNVSSKSYAQILWIDRYNSDCQPINKSQKSLEFYEKNFSCIQVGVWRQGGNGWQFLSETQNVSTRAHYVCGGQCEPFFDEHLCLHVSPYLFVRGERFICSEDLNSSLRLKPRLCYSFDTWHQVQSFLLSLK
jgi:hypothetical protein